MLEAEVEQPEIMEQALSVLEVLAAVVMEVQMVLLLAAVLTIEVAAAVAP